uniref:Uncharacterized protein n=1 Tax=Octopus bimaculoides TaxID=37653 RepID=A0A0L8FIE8_OCTBM
MKICHSLKFAAAEANYLHPENGTFIASITTSFVQEDKVRRIIERKEKECKRRLMLLRIRSDYCRSTTARKKKTWEEIPEK